MHTQQQPLKPGIQAAPQKDQLPESSGIIDGYH